MNLRRHLALAYYRVSGGFPARLDGKRYRLVPEDRKFWRKGNPGGALCKLLQHRGDDRQGAVSAAD